MTRITRFWVVVAPRRGSGLADVLFETTPSGFITQVRGGLGPDDEPVFFDNEEEARAEAERRLAAFRQYRAALDGAEGDRP